MKKHFLSLLLLALFAGTFCAQAQKLMFNYQGVARDTNNQAFKNQDLIITVEIFEGTDPMPVFEETHGKNEPLKTSTLGVFNIKVGSKPDSDLSTIHWNSGETFTLKTAITVGKGAAKPLAPTQLVFVPMAIYADLADRANRLIGLAGGAGISVSGNTIINTGVLLNTQHGGDVSGIYSNLQLQPGVVDSGELANEAVINTKIKSLDYAKLERRGAATGQVLKWNGSAWAAGTDNDTPATAGAGISISGSQISALDISASNEIQSLTWSSPNLSISGGNSVPLSAAGAVSGPLNSLSLASILNMPNGLTIDGGPLTVRGYSNYNHYRDRYWWVAWIEENPIHDLREKVCNNHASTDWESLYWKENFDNGNPKISIWAAEGILGRFFVSVSDRRIKKGILTEDSKDNLKKLNRLSVVNYQYKDLGGFDRRRHNGFIAQEVESVFPEAVSRTTDFIPDIYQIARSVQYDPAARSLTLTLDSLTGGLQAGDKVRIIADQQREVTVAAVRGTTITVQDWPVPATTEAFVYGKKVNDFRVVDYDRIFTLNVSATQALIAEVEELKALVAALQAENAQLKGQNTALQASIQHIEERLQGIVARLDTAVGSGK